MVMGAADAGLPVHTPWYALSKDEQDMVWNGCAHFKGIHAFFATLEAKSYKIQTARHDQPLQRQNALRLVPWNAFGQRHAQRIHRSNHPSAIPVVVYRGGT